MESIKTADSLARLAANLFAPSAAAGDLAIARLILTSAAASGSGVEAPSEPVASAPSGVSRAIDAGKRVGEALFAAMYSAAAAGPEPPVHEIEDLVPSWATKDLGDLENYDFAIRRTPLRTSASPFSLPANAAGRAIARTLGPFLDVNRMPLWIDLFLRVRQTAVVRAPGAEPFLVVPLRSLLLIGAAHYVLPAGSVWILARLLASTAPASSYCGIRIKGGTLNLSAPATVSGGTLQIGAGVVATLDFEIDPQDPPGAGSTLGPDGDASKCQPPANARFVCTASGVVLDDASDARLNAYGTAVPLRHHAHAAGRMEPLVNRVWLPLDSSSHLFRIRRKPQSELFQPVSEAICLEGAWVLPVTAPASSAVVLGAAEGAGGVAVRVGPGLRASWRGLIGGPVRVREAVIMTEPGKLTLATAGEMEARAFQTLRLWQEPPAGPAQASQVTLGFATPEPLRFFSEAGAGDALQIGASADTSLDRPIGIDGSRFPLRGPSVAFLSQTAAGFQAFILADVTPPAAGPPYTGAGSMALTNGLLRLTPPAGLLIFGAWDAPDRVRAGFAAVLFGVRAIIPSLRDPYVSNYALPFHRDFAGGATAGLSPAVMAPTAGLLIAVIRWSAPETPELGLFVLPGPAAAGGLIGVLPPESDEALSPFGNFAKATTETQSEDAAAENGLRNLFDETAGPVRERLLLLDVSSNIDQFGIGFGLNSRDNQTVAGLAATLPLQIAGLDLSAPGRNLRVVLLPQFQWEPVINQFNPLVGPFPSPLASANDGGPTVLGTPSVTLVPIAPERLAEKMLQEFQTRSLDMPLAAQFTLPFGMKASARFQPNNGIAFQWASLDFNRPATADGRLTGGLQIRAESHPDQGAASESPSFPGAAWQTRNGIDPATLVPFGMSVLSATFGNPGVEKFFNDEMGPSGTHPRVPVRRIEFSGYGASAFSAWANPNAIAATSQVRFDVFVGRTAYEVVQVASVLIPWAAPVVRTITLERKKEGIVLRFDSGWVATGPGLYQYPAPDAAVALPPGWTAIETHPGVVRGAWNIRRIRETNRVITHDFPPDGPRPAIHVELMEVRFDADFDIENAVAGAGSDGFVPSHDQVGYVQRNPQGYPILPEFLAAILADEGPAGGSIDCAMDIAGSGQLLQAARVDVAPVQSDFGGPPHFAASARGALALPKDGDWSAVRHDLSIPEPQAADAHAGVPLVRAGTASGSMAASPAYRIAEPADLLHEDTPAVEFGLVQGSEGHRVLFPRPRILTGTTQWSSTEKPALADTYTLSIGVGIFPPQKDCFVGDTPWGLAINAANGRFTLLPGPTMKFNAPPPVADRRLVDTAPFKIRTRYLSEMRFTLNPALPQPWRVESDSIFTTMDLGPFSELLGIRHGFLAAAGEKPGLVEPQTVYPPPLQPVVAVLEFLAKLLGVDNVLAIDGHQGSFNFKASLTINIVDPTSSDGFINLGGLQVKGKLSLGVANTPKWNGFLRVALGTRVPVLPAIFAGGEISVGMEGNQLSEQKVTIEVKWSVNIDSGNLGPIRVSASYYFGIQVITSSTGSWQIGLLVGITGKASIMIFSIAIRIELLAAIKILSAAEAPPSGAKKAIGQAKVAADISIAVFVTITVEFTIQVEQELHL